jgi:hypothetical protein
MLSKDDTRYLRGVAKNKDIDSLKQRMDHVEEGLKHLFEQENDSDDGLES